MFQHKTHRIESLVKSHPSEALIFHFFDYYKLQETSSLLCTTMLSDGGKLILLMLCIVGCIGSYFTSSSVDMKKISPRHFEYCQVPTQAMKACHKKDVPSCGKEHEAADKCQAVVSEAYRYINLGGCPWELRSASACEAEWCDGVRRDRSCEQECTGVRQKLNSCVDQQVQKFFKKRGLHIDGTPM